MSYTKVLAILLTVAMGLPGPGAAQPVLDLAPELVQGGMLTGRTKPGAVVRVDETVVRVSAEGYFLIAASRDRKTDITVSVTAENQNVVSQIVQVNARDYQIQRIDGLPPSQVNPPIETLERIRRESAMAAAARQRDDARGDFLKSFVWPAEGPVSGVYGSQRILNGEPKSPHYGVDVAAPTGTPVVAPAAGIVTLAHPDMYYSGGTLILDHGHGLSSTFLHLSALEVAEGDRVDQGQLIARVGATGRVTGAHLDWRMNLFKVRIDPQLLVPPMPTQR